MVSGSCLTLGTNGPPSCEELSGAKSGSIVADTREWGDTALTYVLMVNFLQVPSIGSDAG